MLNDDIVFRAILAANWFSLHLVQRVHAVYKPAKDRVDAIQMRLPAIRDEELRTIRVWFPLVRHRQNSPTVVLERRDKFVLEEAAVDAVSPLARTSGIAALDGEAFNISVKASPVVIVRSTESKKILARLGSLLAIQLGLQISQICLDRDRHIGEQTNRVSTLYRKQHRRIPLSPVATEKEVKINGENGKEGIRFPPNKLVRRAALHIYIYIYISVVCEGPR